MNDKVRGFVGVKDPGISATCGSPRRMGSQAVLFSDRGDLDIGVAIRSVHGPRDGGDVSMKRQMVENRRQALRALGNGPSMLDDATSEHDHSQRLRSAVDGTMPRADERRVPHRPI
ncbi:hypothetical protein PUNSTDRAFT_118095 [Punctularia strigosozonata HHB-11173 SS5]|uniref:uncharacterized protein n=1 Tax=Punctularia strigosozonata (strain HHB-11173) TaxID=741275 RepID=UPI00044166D7|nr:uncharacterized protein PUNSTDRAFT_118095 [Punctularia strigosozonata HHB-11173 SS5]EIN14681.1 hypothetical protein PUNSTDRAFT_118095 [Punctularia strigosozonata HHB-11173 SS5]